ncbi:MAG: hypothetical protein IJC39_03110 [Firmicutes bacterium]|nr:hypothetical protein [Bacillota bacterium]
MRSANKAWIKNILIIVLGLMLILQTAALWMGPDSGREFFNYALDFVKGGKVSEEAEVARIEPEFAVIGSGEKKYHVLHDPLLYEDISAICSEAIKKLLKEGESVSAGEINWNEALSYPGIVFQFPFTVSLSEFKKGYGGGSALDASLSQFDIIGCSALSAGSSEIYAVFADSTSGNAASFLISDNSLASSLYKESIRLFESCFGELSYISAKESGFNIFKTNVFVPEWQNEYIASAVKCRDPYKDEEGNVSESILRQTAEPFFDGRSNLRSWIDAENKVHIFTDDSRLVKYYEKGLLEYFSYEESEFKGEQSLSSAFYAAREFLKKDKSPGAQTQLVGAKVTSEGLVFCYDYTVDGLTVMLSEEQQNLLGISHAIEITVKDNSVRKYRRYAVDIKPEKEGELVLNKDFVSVLDEVFAAQQTESAAMEIEDMRLGYYADGSEKLGIKWFTLINGKTFVSSSFEKISLEDAPETLTEEHE